MNKNTDPIFKTSVYLHKQGTGFSDVIDEKHISEIDRETTFHSFEMGSGKIFTFTPSGNTPLWQDIVNKFDPGIVVKDSVNNSVVITLYIKSRLVSITFGYGSSKLNVDTLVSDFGRKTSINVVDPITINQVSDVTISDTTLQVSKHNTGINGSKAIFSNNPASFVKGLSGMAYKNFNQPFTIGGYFSSSGTGLSVKVNISVEHNLKQLLVYLIDAYNKDISGELSFLNKLSPVKDKIVDNSLWRNLCNDIARLSTSNFSISFPENDVNYIQEKIPDTKLDLMSKIPGDLANIFLDAVKTNNLDDQWVHNKINNGQLVVIDEFQNKSHSTLKKAIIAEIYYDENQYVLLYGIWYRVDSNFMSALNMEINTIMDTSTNYPNHNSTQEKDYFDTLQKSQNWINVDEKYYYPKDGSRDKVEVADFISSDHKFIHVKYGHNKSSKLSHLFFQGNNTGELMSQYGESEFIDKINSLLTENNFKATSSTERGREIVFLIMRATDKTDTTIPFFAKISLQTVKHNLENLGFKVSWALINR